MISVASGDIIQISRAAVLREVFVTEYENVVSGTFIDRPNRFVAAVSVGGVIQTVHVKNTGRCKELLLPGSTVYLSASKNTARKTAFDLVAVEKSRPDGSVLLINMDSQAPNAAAGEWLRSGALFRKNAVVRSEVRFGGSRFDFFVSDGEKKAFVEVKGVTLEEHGVAMFPDAPSLRGLKHVRELTQCLHSGYDAYLLFVVQMEGVRVFRPNRKMQPEFADALLDARKAGVNILAVDCSVTPGGMHVDSPLPVEL